MNSKELISQAYRAFNNRDVDGALALMTEDVSWPKASEGGRVVGKQAIREYWTRQWVDFDPHVEVLDMRDQDGGKVEVHVHLLVKNRRGELLSDTQLRHVYTTRDELIERMDILEAGGNAGGRSVAFGGTTPRTGASETTS
jgi:ketosteroid isomerase-like protein